MTCVYIMAKRSDDAGLVGPVKIGISNNPGKRLSSIQTACPFPVELAYVFECPDRDIALQMERMFHDVHQPKCLYGEWFDYSPKEAIMIMCLAFHVALTINLKDDQELVEQCLELAGVREAERLLKLPPLNPELVQA